MNQNSTKLGLYSWPLAEFGWQEQSHPQDVLNRALEQDITHYATSPHYGNGKALDLLNQFQHNNGNGRSFSVSLRLGPPPDKSDNFDVDDLKNQFHSALDSLNIDHLELLLLSDNLEPTVLEQSIDFTHDLISEGKLKHNGMTTASPPSTIPSPPGNPDYLEIPYNILDHARDTIDPDELSEQFQLICQDPLHGGLIGQHYADINEDILDHEVRRHHPKFTTNRVTYIRALRRLRNHFLEQGHEELPLETIAISWLLTKFDFHTITLGVRNANELADLSRAREFELTDEDCSTIETVLRDAYEAVGEPYFIQPPPLLPRHTFERHVANF